MGRALSTSSSGPWGQGRGAVRLGGVGGDSTSLSQHFDFLRLELSAMTIPLEKN